MIAALPGKIGAAGASSQANAVVQSVIETADVGANTARAGRRLDLPRQRRDQQEGNRARSRQAMEQADAERLARSSDISVTVLGPTATSVTAVSPSTVT